MVIVLIIALIVVIIVFKRKKEAKFTLSGEEHTTESTLN